MANPSKKRRRHTDGNEPDHLSALPDALLVTILSLLPTHDAARTSVLCRRFRDLWMASPSIDLSLETPTFEATANGALLSRPLSNPLHSLWLNLGCDKSDHLHLPDSFLSSLLLKAHSLGLRHLTVRGIAHVNSIFPTIFSIDSLHSLDIVLITLKAFPSLVTLTRLKTLSITFDSDDNDPAQLNRLLSHLSSLQHLLLFLYVKDGFTLSSQTVQNLELYLIDNLPGDKSMGLSMPSLEMLKLDNRNPYGVLGIHVDVPSLKKAAINLCNLCKPDVTVVAHLLNCVSNVEDLSLHIEESLEEKSSFPILFEPDKDVPDFPNLKHLNVNMCFHEHNFQSIVALLHHSPALELLKLVHEVPSAKTFGRNHRKRKDWRSKLPRNAAGNHNYTHITNLHLGQKREEFIKFISNRCTCKLMIKAHS
ncbi:hypothetical protein LUZ61_008031 [Rhynchospora tenuis]|uniref:F-box domain-containing protein n=1 Tax=Rhynchospora tenuis TaxID=198213 RepID=A0AAD5ZUL3_9POAL|nr:hypothetical protein LUZ61_008031 [Rhynchospora tenuis]